MSEVYGTFADQFAGYTSRSRTFVLSGSLYILTVTYNYEVFGDHRWLFTLQAISDPDQGVWHTWLQPGRVAPLFYPDLPTWVVDQTYAFAG